MYDVVEEWGPLMTILGLFAMLFIGTIIGQGAAGEKTDELGEMVCQERGHGDFIRFEEDKNKIICDPAPNDEKFDSGYIEVRDR